MKTLEKTKSKAKFINVLEKKIKWPNIFDLVWLGSKKVY